MQTRISRCNPLADSDAYGAGPVWSMVDRIYNEDYYSLLHTNYKRSGPLREEVFFLCFS